MSQITRYDLTEDVATGIVDISPVPDNLEGRFVSYEDYAKLEDRLARSDDYCVGVDTERMEYFDKCNALAAENAALKGFTETICGIRSSLVGGGYGYSHRADMQAGSAVLDTVSDAFAEIETPATNAYLNSVRAEGVDMFGRYIALYHSDSKHHAVNFAAKLRAGEPS